MKKNLVLPLAFLFWITFPSCEQVVDIDIPKEKPKLVVNAVLVANEDVHVDVTLSKHILEDDYSFDAAQAQVIVKGDDGSERILVNNEGVHSFPDFQAQPGITYTIEATAPNLTSVSGSTFVEHAVPILDVERGGKTQVEDGITGTIFYVKFKDEANRKNHYRIHVSNAYQIYSTDPAIDTDYRDQGELFFKDVLIDGGNASIPVVIPDYIFGSDPEITFNLETLSESFYRYIETSSLQSYVDGDPLAQPVSVFTNVENGFGIIGSFATSSFTMLE